MTEIIKNGWIKDGVVWKWLENPTRLVTLPKDSLELVKDL